MAYVSEPSRVCCVAKPDVAALSNEWSQPRPSRMCKMILHRVDLYVMVHLYWAGRQKA